ncbi:hypothetical protein IW262DRAFT_878793 [Armillaria fumosa]|nr:hypothetical protein IW262DRAFT_878793 [Armillaria fumosa]
MVDILNTHSGLANVLPFDLMDKIVENNRDDKKSLLASSCVSTLWRLASLPYLFSTATFYSVGDFIRWRDIGYHLPWAPLYVKVVDFRPQHSYDPFEWSASEESEITSDSSQIQLPDMPRVHKLVWDTEFLSSCHLISCTPKTRQFISTFPSLKEVEFAGCFATVSDAKEVLGLFPNIEVLDIRAIDIDEGGTCGESPIFTGDMTKLRKLSIEQYEPSESLDWFVDDILAISCPTQLQIIRYRHDVPFSPVSFARLVALSAESLQKLDIDPPGEDIRGWDNPPPFTNQSFPSLMSLTFAVVKIYSYSVSVFSMNWCRRVIEVFPPAPKMTSLTIHFFAAGPLQADRIAADQSFNCKQLSERTSELFPELKRFIIRVSFRKRKFGEGQRALSEALLKKRLEHFGNKLVIEWVGYRTVWTGFS